jgi:predicted metalloprotease
MHRRTLLALAVLGVVAASACSGTVEVTTERAEPIRTVERSVDDPTVAATPADPAPDDPTVDDPPPQDPAPSTTSAPAQPGGIVDQDAIAFGPNKPERAYDDFLLAVVTDVELWWAQIFPAIYGEPFTPLEGEIYAAYPERPDDIPGCGAPRTTYDDVQQYVAFYCGVGDFIVYDDGDEGLLAELAREYGSATIGTVLAHEYAHAIQLRIGALDRALPTITTEQQADCFAGAWTSRAARGDAATVRFSDSDVRAGLIAMTKVSDPVGIDQFVPGGHGSGFDRVGAFQVGFNEGPERCAELLDDPLPLMPNEFTTGDFTTGGDAAFGYGENDLVGFLPEDLNRYWDEELDVEGFDRLRIVVVRSADDVSCSDLRGDLSFGAALCVPTDEVYFNEPAALELYGTLGDFAVGYVLGIAWSEAVQTALDSELTGESRALLNDCLTGGWVKTVTPIDFVLPQPRLATRDSVRISAGDLDEAIQTVLRLGDSGADDDVIGSAFEKIDSFRTGVIEGTDACLAQL